MDGSTMPAAAIVREDVARAPIQYVAPELVVGIEARSAVKRLVVLTPSGVFDKDRLVSVLAALAGPAEMDVLFLNMRRRDRSDHPFLDLVSLSHMGRKVSLRARAQQVDAKDWLDALGQVYRAGDLVVICAGMTLHEDDWRRRPIAPLIAERFHVPICVVAGVYEPPLSAPAKTMLNILTWSIPVIFLWVQWQLIGAITGNWQTTLLALSVVIEFGLIMALDFLTHS